MHIILCPDNMEELIQVLPVLNYLPAPSDVQTTILIPEDFGPLAGRLRVKRYNSDNFDAVLFNSLHTFEHKTLLLKNNPPELDLASAFQNEEIMAMAADPYVAAINLAAVVDLEAPDPFFNVVYDTEALIDACCHYYPEGSSRPVVRTPKAMASTWAFYNVHV